MSDRNLVESQRALLQIVGTLQAQVRDLAKRAKLAGTGKEVGASVDPFVYTSGATEIELAAATVDRGRWLLIGRTDWTTRHDTAQDHFTGLEDVQVRLASHPLEDATDETQRDLTIWSPHATPPAAPASPSYVKQPFSVTGLALLPQRSRIRLLGSATGGGEMVWRRSKIICVPL